MNGTEAAFLALRKTEEVERVYKRLDGKIVEIKEIITKIPEFTASCVVQYIGKIYDEKKKEEKVSPLNTEELRKIVKEALEESFSNLKIEGSSVTSRKTTKSNKTAYIPRIRQPDESSENTIKMDSE